MQHHPPHIDHPERWVRIGRSTHPDGETAAVQAMRIALDGATDTRLLVVFAGHRYDHERLVRTIRTISHNTPLIGCSTAGEIADSGPGDDGLVVIAFGGAFSVATSVAPDASHGMRDAGRRAAEAVGDLALRRANTILLTLTDTFAGDQQDVLRGIYHELGAAVPVVGGCAGDGLEMRHTVQFHNDAVLSDAVVSAAISSDGPFGIGVRHGWLPMGEPLTVTASEGTVIHEFDSQPALDVYLERNHLPHSTIADDATFTRMAMRHPLALARLSGEPLVRFLTGARHESGSLQCMASVPEGAHVWMLSGDRDTILEAASTACDDALAGFTAPPHAVLVFDCVTRRDILGDDGIVEEIALIAERTEGAPVAGFFTYGEIARTRGISGFHHETLVVLAVG